ncbi:MAG: PAS domain-containing protein, partial [Oscillospiraceae bacterium]
MIDIENLKRIASFFAQIMGSQTEIVIHDITTGEIVWIANGSITGRNIGMHEESITLHFLMDEAIVAKTDDMRIGYRSATRHGRNLRSSQIFMRDENNNVRYVMCINQDITSINMMQGYLNSFCEALNLTPANATPAPTAQAPKTEDRTN